MTALLLAAASGQRIPPGCALDSRRGHRPGRHRQARRPARARRPAQRPRARRPAAARQRPQRTGHRPRTVVSLNTLRTHTKNIYTKLGATSRREAVPSRVAEPRLSASDLPQDDHIADHHMCEAAHHRPFVRVLQTVQTSRPDAGRCPGRSGTPSRAALRDPRQGTSRARWSAWFDGLTSHRQRRRTTAARPGQPTRPRCTALLQKLRDVGLPLLSLTEFPTRQPRPTAPTRKDHQHDQTDMAPSRDTSRDDVRPERRRCPDRRPRLTCHLRLLDPVKFGAVPSCSTSRTSSSAPAATPACPGAPVRGPHGLAGIVTAVALYTVARRQRTARPSASSPPE